MSASNDTLFWLQVVSAAGSLLSGIGIIFTAVSLLYIVRQTKASERATTAVVYGNIVALGNSINEMFISEPKLYEQIFGPSADFTGITVKEEQTGYPKRFYAALRWLDYFETVFVLWPAIPIEIRDAWRAYIKSHLSESRYLRRIVLETDWYGKELIDLCHAAMPDSPCPLLPEIDEKQLKIARGRRTWWNMSLVWLISRHRRR
ncbi:MAG: hypothetical protein WCK89_12690 [bacterium]|nr:hypothetical protein [Candidatus Sumerlaeota bacterium]